MRPLSALLAALVVAGCTTASPLQAPDHSRPTLSSAPSGAPAQILTRHTAEGRQETVQLANPVVPIPVVWASPVRPVPPRRAAELVEPHTPRVEVLPQAPAWRLAPRLPPDDLPRAPLLTRREQGEQPHVIQSVHPAPVPLRLAEAAGLPPVARPRLAPVTAAAPITIATAQITRPLASVVPVAPSVTPDQRTLAREGDPLEVVLDGDGWIYAGRQGDPGAVSFVDLERPPGRTSFAFRAGSPGTALLEFQRQDHATGTTSRHVVELSVLTPADFAGRLAQSTPVSPAARSPVTASVPGSSGVSSDQVAFAERLLTIGQFDQGVELLRQQYRAASDQPGASTVWSLAQRLAELHYARGERDAASGYWQDNLQAPPAQRREALTGLARIAIDARDFTAIESYLPMAADEGAPVTELLLAAGELYGAANRGDVAADYLERYLLHAGTQPSQALFLLAQLLEAPSALRDLRRARTLYRQVVELYPASPQAVIAGERVSYLDRHFFQVR